jgi:hypothetical protein
MWLHLQSRKKPREREISLKASALVSSSLRVLCACFHLFSFPALPPPCPPDFCAPFEGILRLLKCELMHFLITLVLKRAQAKYLKCWSETQFEKVNQLQIP